MDVVFHDMGRSIGISVDGQMLSATTVNAIVAYLNNSDEGSVVLVRMAIADFVAATS